MCEDKPYLADARVGDSVCDMAYGEGKLLSVNPSWKRAVCVSFGAGRVLDFTLNGAYEEGLNQTLFYSKPIFELPPPPKRKVKKVVEGWVNFYPAGIGALHPTETAADDAASPSQGGLPRLGKAHFIRHEYEIEE